MTRAITIRDDLKTAGLLAGAFAALGAATVPLLLPMAPPGARELPLPIPLFSLALALQVLVIYGLLALAGLRLARRRGLEPAPLLSALWIGRRPGPVVRPLAIALGIGLACGLFLIAAIALVQRLAPRTLPQILHPPSFGAALLAGAAASIGEEILCRLFLLSVLLRILPASRAGVAAAVGLSALAFGALHAPGWVFLFGGLRSVPPASWIWLIGLNGLVGTAFALLYLRFGIGGAIVGHFGTDLVWHALSRLWSGAL
jgi:membrane protease YdiL (CAAX protease family)